MSTSVERLMKRINRKVDRMVSPKLPGFSRWLDTLIDEKGIDLEEHFTIEGKETGGNIMPYGCVIEAMKGAGAAEQRALKAELVRIDFRNGDVRHYLRHLAKALVK